jgi:TetR/AcrR family transcriptional repressor of nem operon
MQELNTTAHKILDIAEFFTQTRGFNAFSYKDLQKEVGIKTSSIHYYFPTKQDLAFAMTERYIENFHSVLLDIDSKRNLGIERLEDVINVYLSVLGQEKFCMCGMLASEILMLSDPVANKVRYFFKLVQQWLEVSITLAKQQNAIKNTVDSNKTAAAFLSTVQGAMLIAKALQNSDYLANIMENTMNELKC